MVFQRKIIRGFTLIEVMFAAVALSFGLTTLLRSFLVSLEGIKRFEDALEASYLLEEKMEEVKEEARKMQGIETGKQSGQFFDEEGNSLPYAWSLDVAAGSFGKELNEVNLTVSWQTGRGTRKLAAATYIENRKDDDEE